MYIGIIKMLQFVCVEDNTDSCVVECTNSMFGKNIKVPLPVNFKKIVEWQASNEPIQYKLRMLNADEREFLINGIPPGDFDSLFPPEMM